METNSRKLIVYISCSLDGFIAKPNDDLSFLNVVSKEGEDYGYNEFIQSVDTIIIGRKTFDWVVAEVGEYPHKNKITYVITHNPRPIEDKIMFYNGDIKNLVLQLKSQSGKNIYCDGGAQIVNELLRNNLVDELIVSVIPVILGEGIELFQKGISEKQLKLITTKSYETGLVQLQYSFKNE